MFKNTIVNNKVIFESESNCRKYHVEAKINQYIVKKWLFTIEESEFVIELELEKELISSLPRKFLEDKTQCVRYCLQ